MLKELMTIETTVIGHYSREGLAERILNEARQAAPDPARLTTADLAIHDDMHVGGRKATAHLMTQLGLKPGMKVLDVGSGIGGPARFIAENSDVHVTGIDLTPGYKEVSEALSEATGLSERTEFVTGSALAMPFADGAFDAAYIIHVGMNISDKSGLYREVHRVLKKGALFGVYDVMAIQDNPALQFPLPWAETPDTSFVITPQRVSGLLETSGFEIVSSEDLSEFGLVALEKLLAHASLKTRQDEFRHKIGNLVSGIETGLCSPWQIISRRT